MTRHGQQQLGLVVGALMARVEVAERELVASRGRERELTERVDSLSASHHLLWRRCEQLERAGRPGLAEPSGGAPPRLLAEQPHTGREPRRIPAGHAARRLGVTPQTVRRLVEAGDLEGLALRLPDRARRLWVVDTDSLERFERAAGDAVGALDAENPAEAGLLGHIKGR